MAGAGNGGEGVLVQVCMQCGREYYFEQGQQPEELVCDRCGNEVFRSFTAERSLDEVQEDFKESTDRDLATDDPATDVTLGDLHDLSNL